MHAAAWCVGRSLNCPTETAPAAGLYQRPALPPHHYHTRSVSIILHADSTLVLILFVQIVSPSVEIELNEHFYESTTLNPGFI